MHTDLGPVTGTAEPSRPARRQSPSASTWPARTAASASRSRPPATSRSTPPTAPAPPARVSAPASRSTPSWSCPTPACPSSDGAICPWAGARSDYFSGILAGLAELGGFSVDTPWRRLRAKDKKLVLYGSGGKPVHVQYRNRFGRRRSYTAQFEGIVPWLHASPRRCRVRLVARADRAVHARGGLPGLRRSPAQARVPGGHRRRDEHLRALLAVDRPCRRGGRRASTSPSATT